MKWVPEMCSPGRTCRLCCRNSGPISPEKLSSTSPFANRTSVSTHRPTFRRSQTLSRQSLVRAARSEEHTSELQSLMRITYAVFCLKKKKQKNTSNLIEYTQY